MIKTYCDICGEEIVDSKTMCRYKIKKYETSFSDILGGYWERLTVHNDCWLNLAKLVAERRIKK